MRLIDADTIPWEGFPNDFGEYHEDYVEKRVVDKMPTVDAVKVVRCKDCKNSADGADGRILCTRQAYKWNGLMVGATATRPDDFCSYGERKERRNG